MQKLSDQIDLLEKNLNTYAQLVLSGSPDVSFTYYRELMKTLRLLKRYKALEYLEQQNKENTAA